MDNTIDAELGYLHILARRIDVTCRSYLTKTSKMLNGRKTMF
jgi:hypothetical protein